MTFPDDWPNGCPPEDGECATEPLFRIVKTNPPTDQDFLSFVELGRQLSFQTECPCMPFGLSVFVAREDAVWMCRKYPRLGKFLARAMLTEADGLIKLTKGQRPGRLRHAG